MVKSTIVPDKIVYREIKHVDNEDVGFEASIYEYDIYNATLEIAIGKPKYTYANEGVVYYSIYLIQNNKIISNIGVFEIDSSKLIDILDEEGDIDLEKGNVIFFSFFTKEYVNTMTKDKIENASQKSKDKDADKSKDEDADKSKDKDADKSKDEQLDDDDVTKLKIPTDKINKQNEEFNKKLKNGVFEIDKTKKIPLSLPEETESIANAAKNEYMESDKNTWIETFMKNNNYDIIDNEGNGDCFFAVIRDAFEQIGHNTTIETLRTLLAKEATDEVFQQYRILYTSFLGELQTKEKEMKDTKKAMNELKRRLDRTESKDERQKITIQAKEMLQVYNQFKTEKDDVKELMAEFEYMSELTTLEKFKEFIQTSYYWADTWAISTIEKALNIKVIIMSEETFHAGDFDSVLKCGQLNDEELEKSGNFNPDYYIITAYSGNHYELVSYKEKQIFKFLEVPYDIKSMVINKCMEKNAGPYYIITDFRKLKTKLGLSPDEGKPTPQHEEENVDFDLYDPNTVFVFYSKSDTKPKAGKGSGEKIPDDRLTEFNTLNKDKICKDWRKKLDDSWLAPFTLDGHRWATVEHFVQGNKFKKGFPDFYLQFSLDVESAISNDVTMAKAAGSKSGKLKDKMIRPAQIKFDLEYETRLNDDRIRSLDAKFSQNLDLKKLLMETKDAKLMHFLRSNPPEMDDELMRLRKQFYTPLVR